MKWWKYLLLPFGMALLGILLFLRWMYYRWKDYPQRFPPRWEIVAILPQMGLGIFREL